MRRSPRAAPVDGGTADAQSRGRGDDTMLDLIFIATTVAFFALAVAYTRGCDRL
jgi:hypothetical protein